MTTSQDNTYLIAEEIEIKRQEGNSASLVFQVPKEEEGGFDIMPLNVEFEVRDRKGNEVFIKGNTHWIKSENTNTLYTKLKPQDTNGKAGIHRWYLKLYNSLDSWDIGRGDFRITSKYK